MEQRPFSMEAAGSLTPHLEGAPHSALHDPRMGAAPPPSPQPENGERGDGHEAAGQEN